MRSSVASAITLLALLAACSKSDSTAPNTGKLQLDITGLGSAPAIVTVSGPASYSHSVTSSATLGNLTPGTYTIHASNVAANSSTFSPTPAATSVSVVAGSTPTIVAIAYAVSTGGIALTVNGLATGTNANVTINGPLNFQYLATASHTLGNLPTGSYTISSVSVSNGSNFYDPTPLSQTINVPASTTPTAATVTYAISAGLNLYIDGMYLTQATQTYTGTVPLVKDRAGFLRVFVRANHANTATPKVRVRWYNGGASPIRTDTLLSPNTGVPTSIDQGTLTSSWNIHVPGSLIQPGLTILADVDPGNAVAESNESDNSFPANGTPLAMTVHTENPFNITLVPVRTKVDGLTGNVSAGNAETFLSFLQRIHPVPSHNASVHAIYTTTDSTRPLQSDDANGMWETVLNEITALRATEGAPASQYYYGVVGPNYSAGVAGLGWIQGTTAIGWDRGINDQILAHEVGHNWGRFHSPGCGAGGPDPSYPNLSGNIDAYGLDLSADTVLLPSVDFDIMSYCHPEWTSVFTYTGVMAYREAHPAIVGAAAPAVAPEPVLLVWGRMVGGELVLEPAFEVVSRAQLPEGTGAYTIEGLDDRGAPLFSYAFAGLEAADARTSARGFAFTIPLSRFDVTKLSTLRLAGHGREVKLGGGAAVAALRGGASPFAGAKTNALGGGRLSLTWDAKSYPMALVRDARTGEVLSFARGGKVEIPTSGPVEILVSDGVRSARVQQ